MVRQAAPQSVASSCWTNGTLWPRRLRASFSSDGNSSAAVGGGAALPNANAEIRHTGDNRVLVEPQPYEATVVPAALNVRSQPGMHGTPFALLHAGDVVHVAGFTHDWAGIDMGGRLGFVHRSKITPP